MDSSGRETPEPDVVSAHPDDEGVELLEDDDIILADGGTTWADLTGFQRDLLAAVARLECADETTYGIAIKEALETTYGEINHGRLYPNLDELTEYGLLAKSALDDRTNEYRLTDQGRRLLEDRVRHLASTCEIGLTQPVADGGER